MNDLEKIKALSLHLIEGLGSVDLGEILLTYHVITSAAKILIENNDTEAIGILRGLQQNIFDEIAARIYKGEIAIKDANDFHDKMMDKYYELQNSQHFKDIQASLINLSHHDIDFKKDLDKMASEFTVEYSQIFGVKPRKKRKVPSPDEIINGRQMPNEGRTIKRQLGLS